MFCVVTVMVRLRVNFQYEGHGYVCVLGFRSVW